MNILKSYILTPMVLLSMLLFVSCNNEDGADDPSQSKYTSAYLLLSIEAPSTMADSGPDKLTGLPEESTINTIHVICYDQNYYKLGVVQLTGAWTDAFKVPAKTRKIFVVANATSDMQWIMSQPNYSTCDAINHVEISHDFGDQLDNNNNQIAKSLMMTSTGNKGCVDVAPYVALSESASDIANAMAVAKANPISIMLERTVAKVTLKTSNYTTKNGTCSFLWFTGNCYPAVFYPYSDPVEYSLTQGGAAVNDAQYRKDSTWDNIAVSEGKLLFVKQTASGASAWYVPLRNMRIVPPAVEPDYIYLLENTMSADAQNYNNTTKLLIAAKYFPTGMKSDVSWFRVKGKIMTFEDMQARYKDAKLHPGQGDNDEIVTKFDAFAQKLIPGATAFDDATVTLTSLDNKNPEAGYVTATLPNTIIEYFRYGQCYYSVNIKHDNRVAPKLLGRWGVVRNNWYTINITAVNGPGLPYVPNPTDPEIKDPYNPDPLNPTPDDEDFTDLTVNITVAAWELYNEFYDI